MIPHFESVTETFCGHIIASTIKIATAEQIEIARELHNQGNCPHNVIVDEHSWLYDFRSCYTCGKGLGAI